MKLDPRIEKEYLIYTPFSKTKINLHEKGYFADDMMSFFDLKDCVYGELVDIDTNEDYPYMCKSDMIWHGFYIPESSLKPVEKKLRPFTLAEFQKIFTIGMPIMFRKKGDVESNRYLMLIGYWNTQQSNGQTFTHIHIGYSTYTLRELFEKYEWQEHYTEDFKPFGVEE